MLKAFISALRNNQEEEQDERHANRKKNKLGIVPIPKLLFSMSIPAIISMMIQAMYNIVDSIFVAQIGEEASTAVSLAFPIQMIIISCFVGMGIDKFGDIKALGPK